LLPYFVQLQRQNLALRITYDNDDRTTDEHSNSTAEGVERRADEGDGDDAAWGVEVRDKSE